MTEECALHRVHNPSVARLEAHHVLPDFLANRAETRGHAIDPEHDAVVWCCPTGAVNVEEYTKYLLGEREALPVRVGNATKALAQRAVFAYEAITGAAT